jgi:hypothetical protein
MTKLFSCFKDFHLIHLVMKRNIKYNILITVLTLTTNILFATNYYVATNGNDSNNGTSINSPFKSINYAVNLATLKGGDVVYIKSGTYYERVIMNKSGSSDQNRILIKNYDTQLPVVDGGNIFWDYVDGVDALFEIRSRYVTLDGIKVINAVAHPNSAGILVRGPSTSFVTVIRCVTNNTRTSGIAIWGRTKGNDYSGATDIRIEACDISGAVNDGYHEHLTISEGVDRYVICWNKVHDQTLGGRAPNLPIGIDSKVNVRNGKIYGNEVWNLYKANGIYVDAWDSEAYNIEIYNNIIHDVGLTGIPIGAEEGGIAHDIKVYNNLIYRAGENGLVLSRENNTLGNNTTSSTYNVSFYNNTVYGCGYYAAHVVNLKTPGCSFKNNIFSQNGFSNAITVYTENKSNIIVENNITDGVQNAYLPGMEIVLGTKNISKSPDFAYTIGNNYRLSTNSPAIDMGTDSFKPENDLDWNLRTNTGVVDIGAYEYGAKPLNDFTTETISTQNNFLKIYPNPSKEFFKITFNAKFKETYQLELINVFGKIVYSKTVNSFEGDFTEIVNTSNLMKSMYLLKLSTNKNVTVSKIIVQ